MTTTLNASTAGAGGFIATSDNSGSLALQTAGTTAVTIDTNQRAAFVAGTAALPAITTTGDTNTGIFFPAADTIAFSEGGVEGLRLTSGSDLCAGTTSTLDGSRATFTKAGAAGVAVNRTSDDGALYRCYKDGTSVGYIGTLDANSIFLGNFQTNDVALRFIGVTNDIRPCTSTGTNRDNAVDFGDSSARFVNIWATNGSIQTSDANEKQDIEELSEAETRVAVALKGLLKKYRWKHRVATEGDDARIHFGIIAQDLKAAFEAEGLDAHRYSMFIYSTWVDDETGEQRTRMGVRYNELLAFMVAAL